MRPIKGAMWSEEAKKIFCAPKPENFGDFDHCQKCAEYNQILKSKDLESITLDDIEPHSPFFFSSDEGKRYYMPALVRICLESADSDFYFCELLNLLESDGKGNSLFMSCNKEQREFVRDFIEYMIDSYPQEIEDTQRTNEAFRTYDVWSYV